MKFKYKPTYLTKGTRTNSSIHAKIQELVSLNAENTVWVAVSNPIRISAQRLIQDPVYIYIYGGFQEVYLNET